MENRYWLELTFSLKLIRKATTYSFSLRIGPKNIESLLGFILVFAIYVLRHSAGYVTIGLAVFSLLICIYEIAFTQERWAFPAGVLWGLILTASHYLIMD